LKDATVSTASNPFVESLKIILELNDKETLVSTAIKTGTACTSVFPEFETTTE
jgi:hypothetical protein